MGLSKKLTLGFTQTPFNVIHVKFCKMVLLIELYLFIALSVTLTIFLSQSNVQQF